jgi:DNA-binding MarR family transcriptional regulator
MPGNDVLEIQPPINKVLGYLLRRVSSLSMVALAETLTDEDLRITEISILNQIAQAPNTTSSEIGRQLGIQRANMTPLITGLVDKGYLKTKPKDGRSQALSLTRKGRTAYQQAWKLVEQHEQQFFSDLTSSEQQELFHLLTKIWTNKGQ